jgi:hypothetical protein
MGRPLSDFFRWRGHGLLLQPPSHAAALLIGALDLDEPFSQIYFPQLGRLRVNEFASALEAGLSRILKSRWRLINHSLSSPLILLFETRNCGIARPRGTTDLKRSQKIQDRLADLSPTETIGRWLHVVRVDALAGRSDRGKPPHRDVSRTKRRRPSWNVDNSIGVSPFNCVPPLAAPSRTPGPICASQRVVRHMINSAVATGSTVGSLIVNSNLLRSSRARTAAGFAFQSEIHLYNLSTM